MYSNNAPEEKAVNNDPQDLTIKYIETFFAPASGSFAFCLLEVSTTKASPMTLQNALAVWFNSIIKITFVSESTQKLMSIQQKVTVKPNMKRYGFLL
jgi:hypothetical protein